MKTRKMKAIALTLVTVIFVGLFSACGSKETGGNGEVTIKVSSWPSKENWPEVYALAESQRQNMKEKYPNITIIPDEATYAVDTFLTSAASGQLTNLYSMPFTEVKKIVAGGYAADLTEKFKEYGYENALKDSVKSLVNVDGRYYGIPSGGYIIGMLYNTNLFEEAGLLDEDGKPIYPTNFEELRDTAIQIKEKTGKAGFAFPTLDKEGGWMFMSMAWSFGVKFMEQVDGKWKATFDSPEMVDVLQYISDLKWKYDVLPENVLLSRADVSQLFATDQLAFMYGAEDWAYNAVAAYGMDKNNISLSPVPEGKGGACSQIGGDIYMVSPESTEEQIDAIFKWLTVKGSGTSLDDAAINSLKDNYKLSADRGLPVASNSFSIFSGGERVEQESKAKEPFINVDPRIWNTMYSDKLILKAEEPVEAQQLYAALAPVLQAVLIDKDTDIPALVKKTNDNFQKDFLDKQN